MFFAYNNGLTTTTENVQIGTEKFIPCIKKLSNFQIVNGGQTTASMYYASNRAKSDLSKVFVQMKYLLLTQTCWMRLSLIYPICQHAKQGCNADFFTNHPFHRLLRVLQ